MANGGRIRVARGPRPRRELWAAAVVVTGVLAGRAVLRSGEPPAAPPASGPTVPAPAVPAAPASGAVAPREAPPPAADRPAIPKTMPRSTRGKLRALKALGVEPTRGPDGRRELDAAPVIDALNRAGVHEGIAAFPPPGTDPPKAGLIVPDDWVLPEGYVRHYQTTDDGEALPPILMFHPDYAFTAEDGTPVALPPDRVVPPDLAPPGFPVQMLEPPRRRDSRR